jgi:DNA repair exonuclease SbcCD ATPase subunit
MSDSVVQWLTEIRTLREQLASIQKERDEAQKNEANWRERYNTEASQRRSEAKLAQEQIEKLQLELEQLKNRNKLTRLGNEEVESDFEGELAGLSTLDDFQAKLVEVIRERDRALQALVVEKENHEQTHRSLTAVIGETIDQLAKERQARSVTSDQ